MDKLFIKYLKRGGRSETAIERCVYSVKFFEKFLREYRDGKSIAEVASEDLEIFAEWSDEDANSKIKTKIHLWALKYYLDFLNNKDAWKTANELRQERIKRTPYPLWKFRGVKVQHTDKLADVGIKNVNDMLKAGKTKKQRSQLSKKAKIPEKAILEFVKLSDIARIGGVKTIRARLFHDSGFDTIEKLAEQDPVQLSKMLIDFVIQTKFNGIPPTSKECECTVRTARELPEIVEY